MLFDHFPDCLVGLRPFGKSVAHPYILLLANKINVYAGMYQIREANQMVEEFMLAANVSVANQILKHFPLCSLLRYAILNILLPLSSMLTIRMLALRLFLSL